MLKYKLAVVAILLLGKLNAAADNIIRIVHPQCEYGNNPLGVEAEQPRFSWEITGGTRGVTQTAYHILVADSRELLMKHTGNIWDSRKQNSSQSIQVPFLGTRLLPAKTYYWSVQVWDNKGNVSAWSEPAQWKMGLTEKEDWHDAAWIAYEDIPAGSKEIANKAVVKGRNILPLLRKEFSVKKAVKHATLFIAGLGQFEMSLNGNKVGDHFLDPGWTQFDKQTLYVTFDLTSLIRPGGNALGAMLGNGFYHIPQERYRKLSGTFGFPKMICRLLLEYEDGTAENVVSDASWKTAPGPVTFSSIYGGEDYDANLEQPGWNQPSFDDRQWKTALVVEGPANLRSQTADPVKVMDTLTAKKITAPKPGVWVYDLGQNASGIPDIAVTGSKGAVVKIIPGELIDDKGLVTQQASGGPYLFDYTLNGNGTEKWRPRFSYYGFRYLQVEGAVPSSAENPQQLPVLQMVRGLHIRNAAAAAGDFVCSDDIFNKTCQLINWAVKSNMASVFTDCPHREKLGWLEEAHLMGNAIQYNFNVATLLTKISADMQDAQLENGMVPDIAPEYVVFENGFRDSPEWGSAAVIVPWNAYLWYGDKRILEENYDMMHRYVDYLRKKSVNDTLSYGLGDWFDIGPNGVGESQNTPKGITATAFYYYDLTILGKVAQVLGKIEDVRRYRELQQQVRAAFNNGFFNKQTKQYATGSQAANALAVYMDLVEPSEKTAVVENIVADIRQRNNSLTTGEIAFSYLLRVLQAAGRSDLIYLMNARSDVPGYGYQVAHGATALTESWQAYRYVSNNHLMLGHLMEWFYNGLAGIGQAPGSVAFKQIVIHPRPVSDVTFARASYHAPYGLIKSDWQKRDHSFELTVEIPANTTATVYLPVGAGANVSVDGKPVSGVEAVRFIRKEGTEALYTIGSGAYHFKVAGSPR
ncbi:glycoside hydrolase family 78 protein [Chitinophaga sp. 22321]|uniref:alpha-L-rhamnosidase n=1 Tax=Chitinophaga hostae TaxID=2831022 RepID=A0ABS5J480_9BACT|nr:glycoside hydrolase family 78 protein [Chitinophaga hostae]MBS0029878.1 glycoside hydrolase family 78 protein [Chitinophaga hostae]